MLTPHQKLGIIGLLVASFLVTFVAGLGVGRVSLPPTLPSISPTPGPQPTPEPATLNFVPGYQFYSDGLYILAKDDPNLGLVISVDRHQDQNTYNQSTRATYFNGEKPIRYTLGTSTSDLSIHADKYISSWTTKIDPSRVLKEKSTIALTFPDANLAITTGELTNEIIVRSLPGYTKFFSNSQAELTVNGVSHPAYLVYYHLNSNNASDIYFYTSPLGITTHLLVFWNQAGEAYILDSTDVSRPNALYASHKIAFFVDVNSTVFRSFSPVITTDQATPPKSYTIDFPSPINTQLDMTTSLVFNKAAGSKEDWYISTIAGRINRSGVSETGHGFIEYIHDN